MNNLENHNFSNINHPSSLNIRKEIELRGDINVKRYNL